MKPEKKHTQRWKLRGALLAGVAAAGLLLQGSTAQAQSISSFYPDGKFQFEYTNTLSFVASTPATSITNITVLLSSTPVTGGSPFLRVLTLANLTISGPANNETATLPLTSNQVYAANITIKDSSGNSANTNLTFDTIVPTYTFEAEDWDYYNGTTGGHFIDNPQTNAYETLPSLTNVDFAWGTGGQGSPTYRPFGLTTEITTDIHRRQYAYTSTNTDDYDVGFNNGGDFANYTRHYPAGTYNVFIRGSDGGGGAGNPSAVMGGAATGQFFVPTTGDWQHYVWVPLTTNGSPVQATFDNTQKTITVYTTGGSYNAQFYMFLPLAPVPTPSTAGFTNFYPNTTQFEPTNSFVFDVVSPNPINSGNILVVLGATNLDGTGTSTLLYPGNGLTVTGSSTDWHVSTPITTNVTYSAYLQVLDSSGNPASQTVVFDTIIPTYTWEAEDWNWGTGQFANSNIFMVDWYEGAPSTLGVDYMTNGTSGPFSYRSGLFNENANDRPRTQYQNPSTNDYDMSNTSGGQWADYTRDIPPGVWNIYVRYASGNGQPTYDAGRVSQVVSGQTTASQALVDLGIYAANPTGGWQNYQWAQVTNASGTQARLTTYAGSNTTLRVTLDNAGHNVGFFMLRPADLSHNPPPFVTGFSPSTSALFTDTNTLNFTANSSVGIPQNGVTVNLDGVNVSGLGFSGSSSAWNVSYPVTPNAIHTALITLVDAAGTNTSTFVFNSFNHTNYQVEAEDTDYGSGQFKTNSGAYRFTTDAGAYAGLAGVSNVDFVESDGNPGEAFPYRPSGGGFPTATASDQGRIQFTATAKTDYNIGYFGGNSWGNYTRTYPGGAYNVWGRVAEGAGTAFTLLATSVSGTTNIQGMFTIPNAGWGTWQWQELSNNNAPAVITLPGSGNTTLQLGGVDGNEVNWNFFMLTPAVAPPPSITLTAKLAGSTVNLSFLAPTGHNYQVEFSTSLTSQSWSSLGGLITGDNTTHVVPDSPVTGGKTRYYHVRIL